MADKIEVNLEELVAKYESSGEKLDLENRLRYAMARSMCYGKEVNTPEMKKILMSLVEPDGQTAGQLKSKLVKLFLFADLTGSDLTYEFSKRVYTEKFNMPFGISNTDRK